MAFTGNENHDISLTEASQLTASFRSAYPTQPKGAYYSQQALNEVLNQPGCVGIRYYNGLDESGMMNIVICGVDQNGNDLVNGKIIEFGTRCPIDCSTPNPLNS